MNRTPASAGQWPLFDRFIVFTIITILLLRLLAAWAVPLIPQEAYYWMYWRHPSLSYFDHPPMVAWMIGLGIHLFGDNEFGVRAMAQAQMLLASGVMYLTTRFWYSRRVSIAAALSLQVIPIYAVLGFLATMDASLVLFWLLAMWGFAIAVKHEQPAGWYIAGLTTGAAMLSKYTAAFLPIGLLLATVLHREWRWQLRTLHPWLAAGIAALMFAPVLRWNSLHDWASFRFQLGGRFEVDSAPHAGLHYFVGEHLLILTPIVCAGMAVIVWRWIARPSSLRAPRHVFAAAFSMPMLADMLFTSIHHDVHLNWTAPAFLSLIPPLMQRLAVHRRLLKWNRPGFNWTRLAFWSARACAITMAVLFAGVLTWPEWTGHAATCFSPWRPLAADVDFYARGLERETQQKPLIAADGSFELASEVAFYRRKSDFAASRKSTTSQWIINNKDGLGFVYWTRRSNWIGKDCIYIGPAKYLRATVSPRFDSVQIVSLPDVHFDRPYALAICRHMHDPAERPKAGPQTAAAVLSEIAN